MASPTPSPRQLAVQLRVLWAALLAAQVLYVGLAASGVGRVANATPGPVLAWALAAAALAAAGLAHVFWRRATGAGRAIHEGPPPPGAVFTHALLAWVLDEAIAVFGLVLAVLAEPAATWGLFSAAAAILMLVHRPPRLAP